jgi:hypothetical protein
MKQEIDNRVSGKTIRHGGVRGLVSRDLRSILRLPISSFRTCRSFLARKWNHSIVQIVVRETHSLFRRISAIRRNNMLLDGFGLVLNPCGYSTANREQWNTFQHGCIDHIKRLRAANPWAGHLDCQMAAEAYVLGAEWALRNACNGRRSEVPVEQET